MAVPVEIQGGRVVDGSAVRPFLLASTRIPTLGAQSLGFSQQNFTLIPTLVTQSVEFFQIEKQKEHFPKRN